jgi:hypothetical protein
MIGSGIERIALCHTIKRKGGKTDPSGTLLII